MTTAKLFESILDARVRSPNYFQGRLLTASDLNAEREAHLERQRMLGRAIGAGIVEGLWVEEDRTAAVTDPTLTIHKGVALNGEGHLLSLAESVNLVLTELAEPGSDEHACFFGPCDVNSPTEALPTADGFYLVVATPVSTFREKAPMGALEPVKAGAGCGRKWVVPGVNFSIVPFDPLNVPGLSDSTRTSVETLVTGVVNAASESQLRNLVAHISFGGDEGHAWTEDPWAQRNGELRLSSYGIVDYLRSLEVITTCEVPLAIVRWGPTRLEFVDCWSVRRRPVTQFLDGDWPLVSSNRLRVEQEARYMQFQDHLGDLVSQLGDATAVDGAEYFRYLPAAGIAPLLTATRGGVSVESFFAAVPTRQPVEYINGEQIRTILTRSFDYEAVDLHDDEMVWLYRPWQQEPAQGAGATDRSYVVFTSGHMPPMNISRYDVARWDYSNYAQ